MLINRRYTHIAVDVTTLHSEEPFFVISYHNPAQPTDTYTTVLTQNEASALCDALNQSLEHQANFPNTSQIHNLTPTKANPNHGNTNHRR